MQTTSEPEDADRHVALRVLGFLRRGRHGVEADVGEEDDACGAEYPHDAAVVVRHASRRRVGRRGRNERRVVRRVDEPPADADHQQHDRHLDDDDDAVDERGFLRAADEQRRQHRAG